MCKCALQTLFQKLLHHSEINLCDCLQKRYKSSVRWFPRIINTINSILLLLFTFSISFRIMGNYMCKVKLPVIWSKNNLLGYYKKRLHVVDYNILESDSAILFMFKGSSAVSRFTLIHTTQTSKREGKRPVQQQTNSTEHQNSTTQSCVLPSG